METQKNSQRQPRRQHAFWKLLLRKNPNTNSQALLWVLLKRDFSQRLVAEKWREMAANGTDIQLHCAQTKQKRLLSIVKTIPSTAAPVFYSHFLEPEISAPRPIKRRISVRSPLVMRCKITDLRCSGIQLKKYTRICYINFKVINRKTTDFALENDLKCYNLLEMSYYITGDPDVWKPELNASFLL